MQEIYKTFPRARVYGMGMARMRSAGMELLVDASGLSIMGIVETLRHLPKLGQVYRRLRKAIQEDPPDLLIAIDYPEMGLRLARTAHERGVKVLYYISPKIWGWRAGRLHKIKRRVDMMAVIFPFEEQLYRKAGIPARYVGHPLVADMHNERLVPDPKRETILLLPGSRPHEIKYMLPVLCRAAQLLQNSIITPPHYVLLQAPGVDRDEIQAQIDDHGIKCEIRTGPPYHLMRQARLALAVSGTVTLQLALCRTPMVVIYRTSLLSYLLLSRLIKIPFISLVNIIGGRAIVPELIQFSATPEALSAAALDLLNNEEKVHEMRSGLAAVSASLGDSNSAVNVSRMVRELLLTPDRSSGQ